MIVFAERLKELRIERQMSQMDLAKAVNLSQSAIKQWENNQRTPNGEAIVALARYFNVSADYLMGLSYE